MLGGGTPPIFAQFYVSFSFLPSQQMKKHLFVVSETVYDVVMCRVFV